VSFVCFWVTVWRRIHRNTITSQISHTGVSWMQTSLYKSRRGMYVHGFSCALRNLIWPPPVQQDRCLWFSFLIIKKAPDFLSAQCQNARCRNISCYICRQIITLPNPYGHFNRKDSRCVLWDGVGGEDTQQRHDGEVQQFITQHQSLLLVLTTKLAGRGGRTYGTPETADYSMIFLISQT